MQASSSSHEFPPHPDVWTERMLKACKDAYDAQKKKTPRSKAKRLVALNDLEEGTDPDAKLSSPRSLQSCLHLGVDPSEIVYRPPEAYTERGLMKELQQLKFEHHELQRKEKLRRLKEERSSIMQKEMEDKLAAKHATFATGHTTNMGDNDVLEKDRNRLEILHRRQQKELEQMAKYEAQRQKISEENQARIEAERKAEEKKRQEKLRKEKEWQQELRHRELQKMKEEEELDKKSKQMAAERYIREQQLMQAEQEQSRQLQREAAQREQERLQKQEEYRKQLERMQEIQQKSLREKQEEMHQKELERQKFLELQNKERALQNAEARKHAEERHAAAVENFHHIMQKRAHDYEKRQQDLQHKLKVQEERLKEAEAEKKHKEEMKEKQRRDVLREAQAERDQKVQELTAKAHEADLVLQNFITKKQLENAQRAVERQLEFEDKHARAESMKRVKALQRMKLLQKIQAETDRVKDLCERRASQQERHRQANVKLSIHRQSMLRQMEKLSISKKWKDSMTLPVTSKSQDSQQKGGSSMPSIAE